MAISPIPMTAGKSGNSLKKIAPITSAQTIWLYCAGATWLAASPGRPLAVGTEDGKVLRQEDTTLQWVEVADAVAPAYPG